jgi:hypothetical protein
MRKGNLVVMMFVLLSLAAGLSGCLDGGKPSKEVLQELATKSLAGVVYKYANNKMIIDTPYGTHAIHTIRMDDPEFFTALSLGEKAKRNDKNGIEREVWAVDILASLVVTYNEDERFSRTEGVKYTMFVYLDEKGAYLFENGVLEKAVVGDFGK